MNILVVAATRAEIGPFAAWLSGAAQELSPDHYAFGEQIKMRLLFTGVGATATAWHLSAAIAQEHPDWVINAGIAGALDPALSLGAVVQVVSERFADLGAEDAAGNLLSLVDLGLIDPNEFPYERGILRLKEDAIVPFLPIAHGITVNRVHGHAPSITQVKQRFPEATVESMEGGAVLYGCLMAQIPVVQVRAISNYVEPRDRSKWQIGLAVERLNGVLVEMIGALIH
jgi:futalosine hydrolase